MRRYKDYHHSDSYLIEMGGTPVQIIWFGSDFSSCYYGHNVFEMENGQLVISADYTGGDYYEAGPYCYVEDID